jgi:Leucine-rich repeat (LRR) protein
LEGELDLSDFVNLKRIYLSNLSEIDESKFKKKPDQIKVVKFSEAEEFLFGSLYREAEERENITELDIEEKNLKGRLDLYDFFPNLEELHCENNQLDHLDLSGCKKIKIFHCYNNKISRINFYRRNAISKGKTVEVNLALNQIVCYNNPFFDDIEKIDKIINTCPKMARENFK